jgi:hypothetical protein
MQNAKCRTQNAKAKGKRQKAEERARMTDRSGFDALFAF